jgi:uncharacterized protein involved in exopolysaccharide biosynthesis
MVSFKRITAGSTLGLERSAATAPPGSPGVQHDGHAGWQPHGASNGDAAPVQPQAIHADPRGERFEAPGGAAFATIARHKLLVAVCALLLAALGVAAGVVHKRTYTSVSTLQVGQVNPNSPGFYGYVQSAAALATAFSRAIDAQPVLSSIQGQLHVAPATAVARLSAEPLPSSPAFRVIATGPTAADSIALANVAANAIIAYEGQTNSANPAAASLLHEYRQASLALQRANANVDRLRSDKRSNGVRLRAIETAYTGAVTSQAPRSGLVSLLADATSASSDHKSKIELYGFVGLLAGLALGCCLALARGRRAGRLDAEMRLAGEASGPAPA